MERTIRSYSEMAALPTFQERYEYLRLDGMVGKDTFGFDRYMNQFFYRSPEWRRIRDIVIIRDLGCDLAVEGYEIHGRVLIHHMNPISPEDIQSRSELLLNPEYLVTTTHMTHNAIHYGSDAPVAQVPVLRQRNDTCPWRH